MLRTNITAVFFTVAAVAHMNDNGSIMLLNGSGDLGARRSPLRSYPAEATCAAMASELSPRGIRVNVVAPGAIRSLGRREIATPDPEAVGRATPLGRIGEPEHIAKTVLFLASDDAAHIQGRELFVDGEATASPAVRFR